MQVRCKMQSALHFTAWNHEGNLWRSREINQSLSRSRGGICNSGVFRRIAIAFYLYNTVALELRRRRTRNYFDVSLISTRRRSSSRRALRKKSSERRRKPTRDVQLRWQYRAISYIYSQYYVSCKYDIFTLGYLRAYVTRPLESAMQRVLLCMPVPLRVTSSRHD